MARRSLTTVTIALALALMPAMDAGAQQGMGREQRGMQNYGVETGCMAGLGLTQAQQQEIVRIRQETQQRMQAVRRDAGLTSAQRQQQIMRIQREGHDRVMAVLTPQQRRQFQTCYEDRYGQGRPGGAGAGPGMQGQGVPGVQLSQQQMQQVAQIRSRLRTQIQEVNANPNLTQQQKTQRIQQLRAQAHEDIIDVLTPEQRQQFNDWWQNRQSGMQSGARG